MRHRLLRVAALAALGIALMTASAVPVAQSGNGEPGSRQRPLRDVQRVARPDSAADYVLLRA